ncbi:MAG: GntR family transcriptional regulator [Alphaproteobacteria bacterium]
MKLDPGPMPLYYQLEQLLKERIQGREFGPGDLLPTEEALCEAYGVSRTTVRRVFDSLTTQRIITRRRGVGTFVAQKSGTMRSMRLMGSLDDLLTYPGRLSYRVLSRTEAEPPPMIAKALDLSNSTKVVRLEVIGHLEREPFAYTDFYFPDWVGSLIYKADTKGGLPIVRIIEKKIGQRVVRAEQIVEPTLADAVTAKHLGIKPKTPLLEVVRTYYVATGRPVEVAVVRYHPERYRYTVELVPHST